MKTKEKEAQDSKVKKPIFKKWWFYLIIGVIFLAVIGESEDDKNPAKENTAQSEQNVSSEALSNSARDAITPEAEKEEYINTAESIELFTGEFAVGTDIKPGRYKITTSDGSGNLFVYEPNGLPAVNEILSSSSEDSMGLGITTIEVDLYEGQTINISGLNAVNFEPATIELKTSLTSGNYLVGRDVPAGSYIATAPEGSGNFFVYGKNGMPIVNEILGYDEFGLSVEKVKFSVNDGETISISGLQTVNLQ